MKSPLALAALVAAAVGLVGPVLAQDTTSSQPPTATITGPNGSMALSGPNGSSDLSGSDDQDASGMGPGRHMMFDQARGMGPRGLVNLVCSDRGAEALEVAFVRLSYRLDLTADQQKLFDALKTKALTTQTTFADQCKSAMPAGDTQSPPDLVAGLKARIAIDQARIDALNAVLPDLEAFYDSLTDQQKANLLPQHWMDRGGMNRNDVGRSDVGRNNVVRDARPVAPGR